MGQPIETRVRTYGGWRRARGIGLFGMGQGQTFAALAMVVGLLVVVSVNLVVGLYLLPVVAVVLAMFVLRWGGVPLSHAVAQRLRWWWGSMHGWTEYRGGVVTEHPRAWQLPGVLAPTTLLSAEDGGARRFGVVYHRGQGLMTVTLRCAAASTWLADPEEADVWVANWGGWLASLGHLPMVRYAAVTVDTAPDPGSTLADHVESRIVPGAPVAARQLMAELVAVSPSAAADVRTSVSVTFHPESSPARPRTVEDGVAEVTRALPGLQSALAGCGVTVLGRASAADLAGTVRTAFDPAARGEVNRLIAATADVDRATQLLGWDNAGPVAAVEHRDRYEHDSGVSVTWAWHEAPRQQVHSSVLARLLAPGPFPKRVTLLYRPLSAGAAARVLENEVNAAAFRDAYRRKQGRDETARDQADRQRAQQAATEEAMGAGVTLVSLYVTVTAMDEAALPQAVADVEARAETAKIRLRRMYRSQAAGFATTLPCGIAPPLLATRPVGSR